MKSIGLIEYLDMPENIRLMVQEYYEQNDKSISNDSYVRYPHLMDWDEDFDEYLTELDTWLFSQGVNKQDGSVIIHFDW